MPTVVLEIDGVRYNVTPAQKMEELADEPQYCEEHPGKRLFHKAGKYGPFWTHKNDDGSYHNIKG